MIFVKVSLWLLNTLTLSLGIRKSWTSFEVHEWKCPEDGALYKQIVEKKQVFKFLMGLNKDLDEVRGRVLGTKPLPSISTKISAYVHMYHRGGEEPKRKRRTEHILSQSENPTRVQVTLTIFKIQVPNSVHEAI